MKPAAVRHQPLGQLLIAHGVITANQLRIALFEQCMTLLALGKQMVQMGFVTEAALRDALSE